MASQDIDVIFQHIPKGLRHVFAKQWQVLIEIQKSGPRVTADSVVSEPAFLVKLKNGWPVSFLHVYVMFSISTLHTLMYM